MKYILLTSLILASWYANAAETTYLSYKLNDAVVVVISNVPCPYPELKNDYPLSSAAFRVDGQKLTGCFKPQSEDLLEIHWHKGDITVLPANVFLREGGPQHPVPPPQPTL